MALTVQDLLDALNAVEDKTLPVATVTDQDNYWGTIYGVADDAYVNDCPVHGPKQPAVKCFYIGQ